MRVSNGRSSTHGKPQTPDTVTGTSRKAWEKERQGHQAQRRGIPQEKISDLSHRLESARLKNHVVAPGIERAAEQDVISHLTRNPIIPKEQKVVVKKVSVKRLRRKNNSVAIPSSILREHREEGERSHGNLRHHKNTRKGHRPGDGGRQSLRVLGAKGGRIRLRQGETDKTDGRTDGIEKKTRGRDRQR